MTYSSPVMGGPGLGEVVRLLEGEVASHDPLEGVLELLVRRSIAEGVQGAEICRSVKITKYVHLYNCTIYHAAVNLRTNCNEGSLAAVLWYSSTLLIRIRIPNTDPDPHN